MLGQFNYWRALCCTKYACIPERCTASVLKRLERKKVMGITNCSMVIQQAYCMVRGCVSKGRGPSDTVPRSKCPGRPGPSFLFLFFLPFFLCYFDFDSDSFPAATHLQTPYSSSVLPTPFFLAFLHQHGSSLQSPNMVVALTPSLSYFFFEYEGSNISPSNSWFFIFDIVFDVTGLHRIQSAVRLSQIYTLTPSRVSYSFPFVHLPLPSYLRYLLSSTC